MMLIAGGLHIRLHRSGNPVIHTHWIDAHQPLIKQARHIYTKLKQKIRHSCMPVSQAVSIRQMSSFYDEGKSTSDDNVMPH
jgi:predicted nuclease with RNAse H fold